MSKSVQNVVARPPGRPKAYDPDQALARATSAFWRAGFAGTSLDDLCDAMDLNRPSLYAGFGDKRALYLAALERYTERSCAALEQALSPDVPLATGLTRMYGRSLALYFAEADSPLGCFLIGTGTTEAARDPEVRRTLGASLSALTRIMEQRLRLARKRGELAARQDPALLAQLAAAALHSIALRARAGDSRASLRAFARGTVALLCANPKPRARKR
jgi:AcrR family transcriptional regulator